MNRKPQSIFSASDFHEPDEVFYQMIDDTANIYYVGHRLEDVERTEDILLELGGVNPAWDGKFVFGRANKSHLKFLVRFLQAKFISGYIVWFDSGANISASEFGDFFFKNKKTCFLSSIYKSTLVNGFYSIEIPVLFEKNILGLVFTESGEQSFTVLRRQNEF